MPNLRMAVPARLVAVLGAVAVLASAACSDERTGAGPRAADPTTTSAEDGEDAPLNLSYVCGNRFLVSNAYGVPVSVTYRVAGGDERGVADLPAAPPADPAVSERMIETRTKGAVELLLDGRPVVARRNDGVPCTPEPQVTPSFALTAAQGGQWSAPFSWPIVAVHMMLQPNGQILAMGRTGNPQVWNPATGSFKSVPSPARLFCSGHTLLSDGRILVAGGHITDNHGLPNITLFSTSGVWSSGSPMARGRWYPTATTMSNGDVVITAGRDEAGTVVKLPEVWSNGTIRQLTGATKSLPYYPRAFLAPNGTLFIAGSNSGTQFLSVGGAGSWKTGPTRLYGDREYGSAVMYDDGKILYAGGGRTTNTAETIDLNLASPKWAWTASMAFARRHLNLTLLPTGEVLATGGVGGTAFDDVSKGVHAAELWTPGTGTGTGHWTTLASSAVTRGYHSTSLLLPDGRVLHAGSGEGAGAPNETNAEIFSPPYLFRGARPTISSVPATLGYGVKFRVLTPQASSITHVSFIRLGAVTHAFDENQRFQRLSFTRDATGLTVTAPGSSSRTPPGHYMLFILNGSDVPSVGKIVRIN